MVGTLAASAGSGDAACTGVDLRDIAPPAMLAEVEAEIARTPYAHGLRWIATRGDRQLHIIGTMHLNDPRHAPLVAAMAPAIEQADAMLVEMNPADKAAMDQELAAEPELVFITEGPTLIDRLPDADWQEIADLARAAGIPTFMAAKMRPWFLSMSLSVPQCARDIPNVTEGLDMQLMAVAEAASVPVHSLEDPLGIFRRLDAAPLEEQVAELRSYMAMMVVSGDEFYTMLESYFEGEVQAFTLLQLKEFLAADAPVPVAERQAQAEELMTALLSDRNRAWVPVIEATAGDALVVAVGAAHLPGEDGLLALLAAQGYVIEPVAP
ncbi:TraB/GumN family protein [Phaeobacter sp. HF9A]|nr:TraB/GumN family protein [Phaeobacter sp. HF9A]